MLILTTGQLEAKVDGSLGKRKIHQLHILVLFVFQAAAASGERIWACTILYEMYGGIVGMYGQNEHCLMLDLVRICLELNTSVKMLHWD